MVMDFHRNIGFLNDIVFIDGNSGAGKSILNPLLPLFENVEIPIWDPIYEEISQLESLSKIDTRSAIALLRTQSEFRLYSIMLGRHSNFRYGDVSSIFQNPHTISNALRVFKKEGSSVLDEIRKKKKILTIGSHFVLSTGSLFFKAFEERLKIIEMVRHPASLFNFWVERDWCNRFGKDTREFTLCLTNNDFYVPFFIEEKSIEEYLSANSEEKIIYSLNCLEEKKQSNLSSLGTTDLEKILEISFEEYVTNPKPINDKISSFLSRSFSNKINSRLKKQNIPRILDFNAIEKEKQKILSLAISDDTKNLFSDLCETYESKYHI